MPKYYATGALLIALSLISTFVICAQDRRQVTYNINPTLSGANCQIQAYVPESVDVQPRFPGGDAAMLKFINKERHYPYDAFQMGIEGRVLCSFIVTDEGEICHIEVVRGVEPSLDEEAVRIISAMPRWEAGKIGHDAVPVYCMLAIPFRR
ncbi:MAG: energy transducer TonB [Bacteroidales bacterium]|nr:energy transducer TonB [Bacteroidales bacterium]